MGEFFYNLGIEKAFLTMTEHLESIKKEIDKFSYKKKTKLSLCKSRIVKEKK